MKYLLITLKRMCRTYLHEYVLVETYSFQLDINGPLLNWRYIRKLDLDRLGLESKIPNLLV